jgi:hypothetical protein
LMQEFNFFDDAADGEDIEKTFDLDEDSQIVSAAGLQRPMTGTRSALSSPAKNSYRIQEKESRNEDDGADGSDDDGEEGDDELPDPPEEYFLSRSASPIRVAMSSRDSGTLTKQGTPANSFRKPGTAEEILRAGTPSGGGRKLRQATPAARVRPIDTNDDGSDSEDEYGARKIRSHPSTPHHRARGGPSFRSTKADDGDGDDDGKVSSIRPSTTKSSKSEDHLKQSDDDEEDDENDDDDDDDEEDDKEVDAARAFAESRMKMAVESALGNVENKSTNPTVVAPASVDKAAVKINFETKSSEPKSSLLDMPTTSRYVFIFAYVDIANGTDFI